MSRIKKIIFDAEKLESPAERRGFLAELAVAAGAVALAPMILKGRRLGAVFAQGSLTVADVLNYALTLEYLESTFYLRADNGGSLPTGATIASIDPDGNGLPGSVPGLAAVTPPPPASFSVPTFVRAVRDHEIEHVLFLQAALGGAALARADFEFAFPGAFDSASAFLATAVALEDTGVSAYDGQVAFLSANADDATLAAAGSIAGVEGEHAAAFRYIVGETLTVSNASFDDPKTIDEVLAIAGPFITTAPPLPFT